MGRYTTLRKLKRTFPPLEGEPSVRPQRYTTNPIKWGGSFPPPKLVHLPSSASRRAPPHTEEQQPITYQDSPPQEDLQKTSRKEAKNEPVLVTDRSSTGRAFDQYWLLPLISTGHISDQYWLIFSSRIEYREYSSSRCSYSPLSSGEFRLCMIRQS